MMYSSVGFYGRDPSVLKGGREKSQFILVNLTGPTFSHKPNTLSRGNALGSLQVLLLLAGNIFAVEAKSGQSAPFCCLYWGATKSGAEIPRLQGGLLQLLMDFVFRVRKSRRIPRHKSDCKSSAQHRTWCAANTLYTAVLPLVTAGLHSPRSELVTTSNRVKNPQTRVSEGARTAPSPALFLPHKLQRSEAPPGGARGSGPPARP